MHFKITLCKDLSAKTMKFTLVLSVVLLSVVLSGTQAFLIQNRLEKVIDKVDGVIENALQKSRDAIAGAQEKGIKLVGELKDKVDEFVQKAEEQLAGVLQKVDEKVSEILSALGQPNTECEELARTVRDNAVAAVANVTRCVTEKLEAGQQYVENILTISQEVTDELLGLRKEAVQCAKSVNGISGSVQAIICINKVGAQAAAVSAKAIPEVTTNVVQLGKLVSTFRVSVAQCAAKTGFDTLTENISVLLGGVEECVKDVIENGQQQS